MPDPKPIAESPDPIWQRLRGLFTDIDDTITQDGHITGEVIVAMERLRKNQIAVVPVTGRPAGWCDMIARMWPVDGIVGENGAFYFRYDTKQRHMIRTYYDSKDVREKKCARLSSIAEEVISKVPGAALSADQRYRETDVAIDFREDVAPLCMEKVNEIVGIFEKHGATAKVSSIHVNGWFGHYDKLGMTQRLAIELFSADLDQDQDGFTFIGDSPNDAPMFSFFEQSVGVANVLDYADLCDPKPAWITKERSAAGFLEFAERLLAVR